MLASVALASPALAQKDGRIRIIGHAVIVVVPDEVTVRIGVSNKAPTPSAALDQNSGIARKLIDFTKRFGVDARDIQTGAVSLQPNYKTVRDQGGMTRQEPDGYAANNTVRVRLTDLNRLGELMRAALDQGATNISGVQFGIADQEKWDEEARRKAVEDAVRQANQLADAAKIKLGRIIEIAHPPHSEARAADGAADLPLRRMGAAAPVPIEAGTLQVGTEVEIIWAIE
ncbi:MAG: SIMPL domain-containing protein [Alphaproteobacteria bacterium]|nr:SIMPL domain-containing protein [Alphaproteobacteria bacterium]